MRRCVSSRNIKNRCSIYIYIYIYIYDISSLRVKRSSVPPKLLACSYIEPCTWLLHYTPAHLLISVGESVNISPFSLTSICLEALKTFILYLTLFIPMCYFNLQGIRIIPSNTSFIVKIHLYSRLHVSAPRSLHQTFTVEQIHIWFCTVGIPRVYSVNSWDPNCTKPDPYLDLYNWDPNSLQCKLLGSQLYKTRSIFGFVQLGSQ